MAKKKEEIKKGALVVANAKCANNPAMLGQLQRRSGLNDRELKTEPMRVVETFDGQLKLKHPRLQEPFTACSRMFEVSKHPNT